jgi:hypothetical protein
MSRLTGTDALGLFEAYQTIYSPQELTEEQVWEEVENWVNSLIEEGYDLSDYTWEEMYESYIEEQGGVSPSVARLRAGGPGRAESPKPAPSMSYTQRMQMRREVRNRGRVGGYESPGSSTPAPTPTPAKPAATAPVKPAATASVKPAATASPAASKPSAPGALASATAAASKPPAFNPASTAEKKPSLASQASELRAMQQRSKERQGLTQSFDLFDVIKGHLLDEGYADTEESALAIMANMSEEWKQSIVESKNA